MPPACAVAVEDDAPRSRAARGRARPSARPARRRRSAMRLPFFARGGLRQAVADVVLVVGGDALQAADRDRLGSSTRPRRQAGSHGRSQVRPRMPGKDVRLPVDHVGVGVAACRDQADVFGNGGVGRAGPLAVDDLVEVVRRQKCRWSSLLLETRPATQYYTQRCRVTALGGSLVPVGLVVPAESEGGYYWVPTPQGYLSFRHG